MTINAVQQAGLGVHFAQVVIARGCALGLDEAELLQAAGLTSAALVHKHTRISPNQLGSLLRKVWVELDDELMGFGAQPHRFGAFALMARQMVDSANLAEALRYSVRFINLTSLAYRWELEEAEGQVWLHCELEQPATDSSHFLEELLLLIWHRFSNWLIGERIPLNQTRLSYSPPSHHQEHRLMFPGSVTYGHSRSCLVFDDTWLAASVVRSRQELRRYLQRLPDEWFIKQDFDASVSERVLRTMGDGDKFYSLGELAQRWHVSSRTLHRQLQREGTSYSGLREQVRKERAIALLLEGKVQVREIAQKLDMTEPAFSRAFKQWTGSSPLAYRRARS